MSVSATAALVAGGRGAFKAGQRIKSRCQPSRAGASLVDRTLWCWGSSMTTASLVIIMQLALTACGTERCRDRCSDCEPACVCAIVHFAQRQRGGGLRCRAPCACGFRGWRRWPPAARCDDNLLAWQACSARRQRDRLRRSQRRVRSRSTHEPPEAYVRSCEVGALAKRDVELRRIRVRAAIGHAQKTPRTLSHSKP
jgi:hypothetical protein